MAVLRDPRRFALILVACSAVACGRPDPVRIGFVAGLSGRVADLGISGRDGATLAVEECNRAGGVSGRPVELLVRSDEQDPEIARRVDRELAGLGVVAIVGHMTSAMSVAALPVAAETGVPLVSPTTTTSRLEGLDDQFLRVVSTTRVYARLMAGHLGGPAGLRSVAVVCDLGNREYTESWLAEFRRRFEELGGRVARVETFNSGGPVRFEELARRASAPGVDGVVLVASAMDTAMLAQQLRKIGSPLTLASSEWASTEQLLGIGGAAVEGMVVSQFFERESAHPRFLAFRDAYRARFGEAPGFPAVAAHDAVSVVLQSLGRCGRGEALRACIVRQGGFAGLQGTLRIDRFGDAERATHLAVVERGSFRPLGTP